MPWEYRLISKHVGDVRCPDIGGWSPAGGLPTGGRGAALVAATVAGAAAHILAQQAARGWEPAEPTDGDSLWKAGHVAYTPQGRGWADGSDLVLHAVRFVCRRGAAGGTRGAAGPVPRTAAIGPVATRSPDPALAPRAVILPHGGDGPDAAAARDRTDQRRPPDAAMAADHDRWATDGGR